MGEHDDDDATGNDDAGNDDARHDDDGAAGRGDADGLRATVEALRDDVAKLLGTNDDDKGDQHVNDDKGTAAAPASDLDAQIERAMTRVAKDTERDQRLEKVERAIEKPPVKQGRLSRALWGKVDA